MYFHDPARGLQTVHLRHVDVHGNDVRLQALQRPRWPTRRHRPVTIPEGRDPRRECAQETRAHTAESSTRELLSRKFPQLSFVAYLQAAIHFATPSNCPTTASRLLWRNCFSRYSVGAHAMPARGVRANPSAVTSTTGSSASCLSHAPGRQSKPLILGMSTSETSRSKLPV